MNFRKISMRGMSLAFMVLICHANTGFALDIQGQETPEKKKDYDLILEAVPVEARPLARGASADAIENLPKEDWGYLQELVIFEIKKISRGRLEKLVIPPPSTLSQMQDAVKDKNLLGLVDYDKTAMEIERSRFRVAVRNAVDALDLNKEKDMGKTLYRLYCKRYNKETTTYILIFSEKIS